VRVFLENRAGYDRPLVTFKKVQILDECEQILRDEASPTVSPTHPISGDSTIVLLSDDESPATDPPENVNISRNEYLIVSSECERFAFTYSVIRFKQSGKGEDLPA